MFGLIFPFISFIILNYIHVTWACTGCVELDEYTFDKLISKFDASLVKFDVAFPYGDKEDAFAAIAKDAKTADTLLVAQVGVKDYGERENEELAKRFGITKEDFPVVKLFVKGKKDPLTFSDSSFTADALRKFLKVEGAVRLTLEGCISKLDKLAIEFMAASIEDRSNILKKLENAVKILDSKDSVTGKTYQIIMQRVLDKGDSHIGYEIERLKKLKEGKLSSEKKNELNQKLNILQTFLVPAAKNDEL